MLAEFSQKVNIFEDHKVMDHAEYMCEKRQNIELGLPYFHPDAPNKLRRLVTLENMSVVVGGLRSYGATCSVALVEHPARGSGKPLFGVDGPWRFVYCVQHSHTRTHFHWSPRTFCSMQ